jgi:hypothetical protein
LKARAIPLQGKKNIIHYRPLHFPEKCPGVGRFFRILNENLIQREVDQLLPPRVDRIACYDSPTQYPLVKKFREQKSIYLAIDDRTRTVWGDSIPGEAEAEMRLLGKVDQVICVSGPLAQTLKSRTPEGYLPPIAVLPNGYDERIFNSSMDYPEPFLLKDIPRPRILIAGHISERIDWDGIAAASVLRPEWTWIFLGPADAGIKEKMRCLLASRAILHAPISAEEIPVWISHVDACAIPYRLNPFTLASDPRKGREYLSMGAAVIGTRIPSLEKYEGLIEWAEVGNGQSYTNALDKLLQEGNDCHLKSSRKEAVEGETWQAKTVQFKRMVIDSRLISNSHQTVLTYQEAKK